MKLEDWRKEIDEIDAEIVKLINQRARIAGKIGALKAKAGLPVTDADREQQILRNVIASNDGLIRNEAIVRIYQGIIQETRRLQIEARDRTVDGKRESVPVK